jgi:hypothetical protein
MDETVSMGWEREITDACIESREIGPGRVDDTIANFLKNVNGVSQKMMPVTFCKTVPLNPLKCVYLYHSKEVLLCLRPRIESKPKRYNIPVLTKLKIFLLLRSWQNSRRN